MAGNKLSLLVSFVAVDKLSGALKNIVGLGRKGSASLGALRGEGRKLESQLRKVRAEIAGTSGNVTTLMDRERQLERSIERTNAQIQRRARLNAIEGDRQAMLRRADSLKSKGQSNVYGGVMMAVPIIAAVKNAADFSSIMTDIQLKADLSNIAMLKMSNQIKAAADSTHQMPAELASAVDALAGIVGDPETAAKAVVPMGKFMTAFKVQGTDAASAVAAGLQNLRMPVEQMTKLFDMMAVGQNKGAFEARDMAAAFPELTAQMRALGQTGQKGATELIAGLEIIRRGSGDSAQAATNMNDLLTKLTAPVTMKAFAKHGIDAFGAVEKGIKKGISPLETMIGLSKKATGGDLLKLNALFRNQEAAAGMRQLVLDYKDFQKMKDAVAKGSGTTQQAFNKRVANDDSVALGDLARAMVDLALASGPILLPFLRKVTSMVSANVKTITGWAKANPQAARALLSLVAAVVSFKIGLGVLQFAFGGILGPAANFISIIRKMGGLAGIFGAVRTAALFLGSGLLRAGAMMLANPIVLVITAIVVALGVAAYLIYTHWDRIKAAFSGAWTFIKGVLAPAVGWMKSIGHLMMDGLIMALNPSILANRLLAIARRGVAAFKNFFGIKSPSRLMMTLGHHTATGLALGIDRGRRRPMAAMGRLAAGVAGAGAMALTPVGARAAPAGGSRATAGAQTSGGNTYILNIHQQPGENAEKLAERVVRLIERKNAEKARRSYSDDG